MTAALQLPLTGVFEHGPGDAASESSSLEFVLASIPSVGHTKGTSRENLRRPVAEVYLRGTADHGDGELVWHREQSKRHVLEHPRADARRVAATHGDARVWVTLLRTDFIEVVQFCEHIGPGLVAVGATLQRSWRVRSGRGAWAPTGRITGAMLSSIHQFVIALCWEPAVAAGCFLASAVEPLSDQWAIELDRAQDSGAPWGLRLAELSALHGPLVRAWRWLWETRSRWDTCGICRGGSFSSPMCDVDTCHDGKVWVDRRFWLRTAS